MRSIFVGEQRRFKRLSVVSRLASATTPLSQTAMSIELCTIASKVNALAHPKQQGGSTSSDSDKQSPEAFKEIPFDVKDHILSLIDSPRDLLALSLTSREWGAMILPLHIRYRELRIRANQPEIWQHLATRMDLAKNIRKVCLMAPNDRRDERLPLKTQHIVKDIGVPIDAEGNHAQPEMVQALSHFESLTSFTWLGSEQNSQFTEGVFGALAKCHELVELILGGLTKKDRLNPESSIWTIRNLRILALKGGMDWASFGDAEYSFISMLNNSPALEELTIPYNCSSVKFTSCRFRFLIKLHISAPSSDRLTNNLIIDFLFAHPTIQDLSWYPIDGCLAVLPPRLLPTLKRVSANHRLVAALLSDNTVIESRTIETISSKISLDLNMMKLLGTINGSRLQEIHLGYYDGIETIRRLAILFPTIKTLEMPHSSPSGDRYLDEYIDCLDKFPLLEILYDFSVWCAIHAPKTGKGTIRKLYTRCSALKTIRAMMQLREEVVFFRNGFDVTWKEQNVKDVGQKFWDTI